MRFGEVQLGTGGAVVIVAARVQAKAATVAAVLLLLLMVVAVLQMLLRTLDAGLHCGQRTLKESNKQIKDDMSQEY